VARSSVGAKAQLLLCAKLVFVTANVTFIVTALQIFSFFHFFIFVSPL